MLKKTPNLVRQIASKLTSLCDQQLAVYFWIPLLVDAFSMILFQATAHSVIV